MAQEEGGSPTTTKATAERDNPVRSRKQTQHQLNKTLIEEWHNQTF